VAIGFASLAFLGLGRSIWRRNPGTGTRNGFRQRRCDSTPNLMPASSL